MAVAVRLTCDAGQRSGEPCPAQVALAVRDGYEGSIMLDNARAGGGQEFNVETEWLDVPAGWRFSLDGEKVFCPEHQSAA